jgi:cytoskeleton protein RodZ
MFESIGQRLKKERVARFLTLEKASEATRIRIVFLQALESDDYSVMPSAAQGRGFLRNYAEYLELNIDEMIADIQRNAPQVDEVSGPLPQVNLAETEIPPLTSEQEEKPARSFLGLRLGRRPKAEPTLQQTQDEAPQLEPVELAQDKFLMPSPMPAADDEVEQPKPRGRKKKKVIEEALQPISVEPVTQQAEVVKMKTEELSLPVEQDQVHPEQGRRVEVKQEAKPGLISRLAGIFQSRAPKVEPAPNQESTPVIESESRQIPVQPADVIFAEIGMKLRERRELISLTFDEVERHTKLRAAFVKALEDGAFDKLPSPVQTRGMLANYATFLDLDTDVILLRFADGLQARRYEKYAETPREKIQTEVITSMPFLRSFIAGDLIFGVVMIAILFALAIWGVGRVVSSQNEQNAEATAPSIVDILGNTPLPTASLNATFAPVDENSLTTPGAETPANLELNANVVVSIFAVERVFARISVDGELAFEGRFTPGETMAFEASDQVMVLTGNAAALRITYNGRDLGLMGNIGEVVSRVYLITGVAVPTPTISPTPTNTLPPTITLTPTLTPTTIPTVTPPDGG